MFYELFLPFPPSINNYYVKTQRGVFISQKGRAFRAAVQAECLEQLGIADNLRDRLLVTIILSVPDKRIRDVDNYVKPLLDALTHAEVWEDDKQIDQLFIYRGAITKPKGRVKVTISLAGPVVPLDFEV